MSGHWNQLCGNVPFQRRDFSERKDWSNLLEWHRYAERWHSKIDHQHPHVLICITARIIAVSIFIQESSAIDKRSSCKATPKFSMLTQMSIWSFIKTIHKKKLNKIKDKLFFLLNFMLMFFFYIFSIFFLWTLPTLKRHISSRQQLCAWQCQSAACSPDRVLLRWILRPLRLPQGPYHAEGPLINILQMQKLYLYFAFNRW